MNLFKTFRLVLDYIIIKEIIGTKTNLFITDLDKRKKSNCKNQLYGTSFLYKTLYLFEEMVVSKLVQKETSRSKNCVAVTTIDKFMAVKYVSENNV